jgi:hypothetical protein
MSSDSSSWRSSAHSKAEYLRLLDTKQWDDLPALLDPDSRYDLATFDDRVTFTSAAEWMASLKQTVDGAATNNGLTRTPDAL